MRYIQKPLRKLVFPSLCMTVAGGSHCFGHLPGTCSDPVLRSDEGPELSADEQCAASDAK